MGAANILCLIGDGVEDVTVCSIDKLRTPIISLEIMGVLNFSPMSNGFIPIVMRNACGDRHESPRESNLFDMQAKYAEVWNEEAVCNYLDKSGRNNG